MMGGMYGEMKNDSLLTNEPANALQCTELENYLMIDS